jgi:hypothetical protein
MPAGLTVRRCTAADFVSVLEFVEEDSTRKDNLGWYDQYTKLANTLHVRDIVLAIEGSTILATALTYVTHSGSPLTDDLPWVATISPDVGGVTCICTTGL